MEFIFVLGLIAVVTFFLPWIHLFRLNKMRDEINQLNVDVLYLLDRSKAVTTEPASTPKPAVVRPPEIVATTQPVSEDNDYEDFEIEDESPQPTPQFIPAYTENIKPKSSREDSMEFNLGTKLPVWIGAISLICAAFFTVKYSIEAGWFGPLVRTCMGVVFGATLATTGHVISRRLTMANHERIGQGLVGAGLVSLYVSIYAAVNLYALIGPMTGFVSMAAVTGLAVVMSLRHGQPIAVFGLVGGLLTPALIGSQEPNAVALFAYLFALFIGVLFIMVRQGWWTLASLALGGMFFWTAAWFFSPTGIADSGTLVLFVIGLCTAVIGITRRALLNDNGQSARPAHNLNLAALAGAALTITMFSTRLTLSLFDWSMFGLLSCAILAMAYLRPEIYFRALLAKASLDLLLFALWLSPGITLSDELIVLSGLTALYTLVPGVLMRNIADPRSWAKIQAGSALGLFLIVHYCMEFPYEFVQQGFWGTIALILTTLSVLKLHHVIRHPYGVSEVQNHLIATYALAATAFLSFGMSFEISATWLPVAFSAQAAATMWIMQRTQISFLKKIVFGLSTIFLALNYKQIILFASLALTSLVKDTIPASLAEKLMLGEGQPIALLGLPLLFTAATAYMLYKYEGTVGMVGKFLGITIAALFTALSYYSVRSVLNVESVFFANPAGFTERGVITLLIAVAALIAALGGFHKRIETMKLIGTSLVMIALGRIVYFDLFLFNPYFDRSQVVGSVPLFNGLTLTYGIGAALATLCARSALLNRDLSSLKTICRYTAMALLFTFVSFTARHAFHGMVHSSAGMSNAELYTYSIVWMLTSLGLLAYGLVRDQNSIRMAALGFMVLTIGKVFLFDASELEGLYRIASFLGLGVSLIGLSYFYTRFILKK